MLDGVAALAGVTGIHFIMKKRARTVFASTAFIVLAALFWGLSGGIGGILMADGWDAFVVSFYRGAIGLLFALAWLSLRPRSSGLTNRWLWLWSVVAGFGVAGNFSFYFVSIAQGSVAVAATLMYCAPIFVYRMQDSVLTRFSSHSVQSIIDVGQLICLIQVKLLQVALQASRGLVLKEADALPAVQRSFSGRTRSSSRPFFFKISLCAAQSCLRTTDILDGATPGRCSGCHSGRDSSKHQYRLQS